MNCKLKLKTSRGHEYLKVISRNGAAIKKFLNQDPTSNSKTVSEGWKRSTPGSRGVGNVGRKILRITGRGSREVQVSLLVTISARLCFLRYTSEITRFIKTWSTSAGVFAADGASFLFNNWTTPLFPPRQASVDREKAHDSRLLCRHVCIDKRRD